MKKNIVTLDVETQKSSKEVGGWDKAHLMKIACVVIHSTHDDLYRPYSEKKESIKKLEKRLLAADLVVGFNIINFDYKVMQPYMKIDLSKIPTFDILQYLHKKLGHRVSLNSVASATLGTEKSADGLISLEWWKQGEVKKIMDYCKQDVTCTKDVYFYGKKHGKIYYSDYRSKKNKATIVDW